MVLPQLLRWRARLAVAALRGRGGRRRVLQVLVSAWVAAMFLIGSTVWFRAALADSSLAAYAAAAVFGALHAAFLLSLVRDMGAAIGHLFQAADVPLLLSAPVRARPLVLLRAGEALADAAQFPAPLLAPILWGYGIASSAPWIYYVAVPLVMAGLLAFSVVLGFLISLFLAPRVPVGRARSWIRGATALLYLSIWIGLTWWNVSGARHLEATAGGLGHAALGWSAGGPAAWIPSAWAARFLIALAGEQSIVAPLGLLLAGGTALATLLALVAPRYPEAWQRAQEKARPPSPAPRPLVRARVTQARPALTAVPPRATRDALAALKLGFVLFRRDRRLLVRDANLLWDMALLVFMSSVLPILAAPVLAGHLGRLVLFALVFFSAELGFDLASRALPLERRALPWILEAPVSSAAHVLARLASAWLLGWPIVVVVALIATGATGWGAGLAAFHVLLGSFVFTVLVPIGFAAGVFFGQPDWRHPRQMLNLGGRLVLAGILVALSVTIAIFYAEGAAGPAAGEASAWLAPIAGIALGLDVIVVWAAASRLRRFQWMD